MTTSSVKPTLVMIIRHGEKPGDSGDDKGGGPNLSIPGSARAAALPSLFTPDPTKQAIVPQQLDCDVAGSAQGQFSGTYGSSQCPAGQPRFPTPVFLYATKQSGSSNRPAETITPLAQAIEFLNGQAITINQDFKDKDTGPVASDVMQNCGGKVVLICWHHGQIPQLVSEFNVPASQFPPSSWTNGKWPPNVFDLVLSITWTAAGDTNLVIGCQQLLFGDSSVPPG